MITFYYITLIFFFARFYWQIFHNFFTLLFFSYYDNFYHLSQTTSIRGATKKRPVNPGGPGVLQISSSGYPMATA